MSSVDLELLPRNATMIREWSSKALYALEIAGSLATFHLDERIVGWAGEGWTQAKMAEEIGCSQQGIAKRLKRLGVKTKSRAGQPALSAKNNNRVVIHDITKLPQWAQDLIALSRPIEIVPEEDTETLDAIEEICPCCHGTGRVKKEVIPQ